MTVIRKIHLLRIMFDLSVLLIYVGMCRVLSQLQRFEKGSNRSPNSYRPDTTNGLGLLAEARRELRIYCQVGSENESDLDLPLIVGRVGCLRSQSRVWSEDLDPHLVGLASRRIEKARQCRS